ncbi:MAG: tagatose-6-phosphate kinase [Candidatus Melainabacteria bacterium]|nr:tagatose-6-phosphate kinase [Candidatus Melainabacteria bacterium]
MIRTKLETTMRSRRCTLLGVGPMSVNCVDASIEIANDNRIPLMLIASRRQIDSADFGGGYVNNWTTEEFSKYVIENDKRGYVLLARDHGGPWQNTIEKEKKLSLRQAMESAKKSYEADIRSGFQIIHIDPSEDIFGRSSTDEILERVYELLDFCTDISRKTNNDIAFEIGTEEQSGGMNTSEELEHVLSSVMNFCEKNTIPKPLFVVMQTGTKVMETKNVGTFDTPFRIADEIPAEIQIPKMIELCEKYGIYMKEHNTDYLSTEALRWHPKVGIHAANVAPEFGVEETRAFLELLEANKQKKLAERFLKLAYDSNKWNKWMLPGTDATDRDRSIIAGHYVFATPEFLEIKAEAVKALPSIDIEAHLKSRVKESILRYVKGFRLIV